MRAKLVIEIGAFHLPAFLHPPFLPRSALQGLAPFLQHPRPQPPRGQTRRRRRTPSCSLRSPAHDLLLLLLLLLLLMMTQRVHRQCQHRQREEGVAVLQHQQKQRLLQRIARHLTTQRARKKSALSPRSRMACSDAVMLGGGLLKSGEIHMERRRTGR